MDLKNHLDHPRACIDKADKLIELVRALAGVADAVPADEQRAVLRGAIVVLEQARQELATADESLEETETELQKEARQ